MRTTRTRSVSPGHVLVAALTALLLTISSSGSTAHALTAFCGSALTGVSGDYTGTRDNGHPLGEPDSLNGWNGRPGLSQLKLNIFAVGRTQTFLGALLSLNDRFEEGIPAKVSKIVMAGVAAVFDITIGAMEIALQDLQHQNDQVDACGGALLGDFVDVMYVTMLEEDLAYANLSGSTSPTGAPPAPGTRLAPSAMYMLPQDGWPAWQRDASLYSDAAGHATLNEVYVSGSLNGDYIGVAVTVRNQIAYLEASGIDTGTTTSSTDPYGNTVTIYGAKELWMQAMTKIGAGDEREAWRLLALAYQTAVSQNPPPGATSGTGGNPAANPGPSPSPSPSASPTPWTSPAPTPSPSPTPTPSSPPSDPWG